MSVYPIADYVTVYPTTSDVVNFANGESEFRVPPSSYSSNAKGPYCLVSLADGCIDLPTQDQPFLIILDGVQNNGAEDAVIGSFQISAQQGGTTYHHTFVKNDVKYLISARPAKIRIKVKVEDLTELVIANTGYLTFKFEYLTKEAVALMNEQSDYTTF